ncbi:DUF1329 domain-containing protein [Pyruvatibacter sp.]|uniref:DUF1329 domain-containing protein n=1 Tax=Pyruvatibacter sp. TaxID=1981328 RepID=UPI0032631169
MSSVFNTSTGAIAALLTASAFAVPAVAGVSQAEADKLGTTLTPIGAEKAGNADGTIPAWEPLANAPAHTAGDFYADPYADDAPLFTITSENKAEYADKLTGTHAALLDDIAGYKMIVYPSRRNCAYPDFVNAAIKQNALNSELVADGNGVANATIGAPFPIPTEAVQLAWNHNLRYRGYKLNRQFASIAPDGNANFTPITVYDEVVFTYSNPDIPNFDSLNNISLKYLQTVIAPSRRAGELLLVHETINQVKGSRNAWQYNPGTKRVRRAPTVAYDNPQSYADGRQTTDQFDLFNGSPDRYTWTMQGKSEKYIAYNSYKWANPANTYDQMLQPASLNQDLLRYELHRVWTVEAKIREGQRHIYTRRVKSFDEDTYNMVTGEMFDSRGQLWRVQEGHILNYYDVPTCWNNSDVTYDIQADYYNVQGLKNQEREINYTYDELSEENLDPAALRRRGVR